MTGTDRLDQPDAGPRSTLGDECEAYLAGRVIAFYDSVRCPPCWVQLNTVARGSFSHLEELAVVAETGSMTSLAEASWPFVLTRIARQILAIADGADSLDPLQRNALWHWRTTSCSVPPPTSWSLPGRSFTW